MAVQSFLDMLTPYHSRLYVLALVEVSPFTASLVFGWLTQDIWNKQMERYVNECMQQCGIGHVLTLCMKLYMETLDFTRILTWKPHLVPIWATFDEKYCVSVFE